MSWEAAVVSRLLLDSAVNSLAGQNVEWDEFAPDTVLPAIVLNIISDPRPQNYDGFDAFRGTRVQVNSLAKTKAEAVQLRNAAIAALAPAAVHDDTEFLRSFVDGGGSDAVRVRTERIIRERADLIIWHN
ncbi:MAG: DUF3168 domain-containing protein [Pseudomonadota bacterium]